MESLIENTMWIDPRLLQYLLITYEQGISITDISEEPRRGQDMVKPLKLLG
jgi:hypothetical protein